MSRRRLADKDMIKWAEENVDFRMRSSAFKTELLGYYQDLVSESARLRTQIHDLIEVAKSIPRS